MRELNPLAIGFSCPSAVKVSDVWFRPITMSTSRCSVPYFLETTIKHSIAGWICLEIRQTVTSRVMYS
jgi:hypothetical protein